VKLDFSTLVSVNAAELISLTVAAGVPVSIHRRGGRKLVLAPDGTNVTAAPVRRHIDNAMVKAIARAFAGASFYRSISRNHSSGLR
jgi:hypothetical protein